MSAPTQPIKVNADQTRLAQVLSNLLNNAAKYTQEGGHIWLSVAREGDNAVFRVRDNGSGIPAEILPRVFDLFTQADQSLERAQGGLGIGLTLVRRLVEMHHGSVQANSSGAGQGSEFIVRLPALPADRPAPPPAKGDGNGRAQPAVAARRILVVDDNMDTAESLAMLMRIDGHEVRTAHDGIAALQTFASFGPQVVILDIGLPNLDGYEVARRPAPPAARRSCPARRLDWLRQRRRPHPFPASRLRPPPGQTSPARSTAPVARIGEPKALPASGAYRTFRDVFESYHVGHVSPHHIRIIRTREVRVTSCRRCNRDTDPNAARAGNCSPRGCR